MGNSRHAGTLQIVSSYLLHSLFRVCRVILRRVDPNPVVKYLRRQSVIFLGSLLEQVFHAIHSRDSSSSTSQPDFCCAYDC